MMNAKAIAMPPTPPPDPAEKRRHPRRELMASVRVQKDDITLILPALNVSLGGALLGADNHDVGGFGVGETLDVDIFDPLDEKTPSVKLAARVVRRGTDALALSFIPGGATGLYDLAALFETLKPRR